MATHQETYLVVHEKKMKIGVPLDTHDTVIVVVAHDQPP